MNDQLPDFRDVTPDEVKEEVNDYSIQSNIDLVKLSGLTNTYESILSDPAERDALTDEELTLVFGIYKLALLLERVDNEWEPREH